jgi:serine protease Do
MLAPARAAAPLALVLVASAACDPNGAGANPQFLSSQAGRGSTEHDLVPDVAERVVPSVVNVSAVRQSEIPEELFANPLFRRFFGAPGEDDEPELFEQAVGSGVVVDRAGLILTSSHIVTEADDVRVALADGRELTAVVVGRDPPSDLAVIRLLEPPPDLQALPFGDSTALRLGETVLAVGNPFGVGKTVTMGIVSATGRSGMGIVDYEDFIQTDAAINPGNSGGALVNLRGELVGINTAILTGSGGTQGIGFAIPSAMAQVIMRDLIEHGRVNRGVLGVQVQDITQPLAQALDLGAERGALVAEVVPGGPGERAGLARGDVIVAVNDIPVDSGGELRNLVALQGGGERVRLRVLREGQERLLAARLDTLEPEQATDIPPRSEAPEPAADLKGLELNELDESTRRLLEVPEAVDGVLVTRVDPSSAPGRAGLREGDVIVQLDRRPVASVGDFRERFVRGEQPALLLVLREGARLFVALPRS